MSDRYTKPENKEVGFRELFVETRPARQPLAGFITPEDLDRRCADLPSRGNARINALQDLVVDLKRSHAAMAHFTLDLARRQDAALNLIVPYHRCGGTDVRLKAWVIDQVTRTLAGDCYAELIAEACAGEDGPTTYAWDVGIAP
jgi:hypothetical protein